MLEPLTGMGSSPTSGRFLLYVCDSVEQLIQLPRLTPHFAICTAFDLAETPNERLLSVAKHLADHGLAYACCWGTDCERWHDMIDAETPYISGDDVVMTTWHSKESLKKALRYFSEAAIPTPMYEADCRDYVIACSPDYEKAVRKYFKTWVPYA